MSSKVPVNPEFVAELKAMILDACDKTEPADGLRGDEALFGPKSRLDLDSIDALQISMAIQKRYGIRMPDSKETRRARASLVALAEHLAAQLAGQGAPVGK